MKKLTKKLTVLGTVAMPTSLALSCGASTPTITAEEQAVIDKVNAIQEQPATASLLGETFLPSQITNPTQLKEIITNYPSEPEGITISPQIKEASDEVGTLLVNYEITKGIAFQDINITYQGFLTTSKKETQEIVENNINIIKNDLDKTTNSQGAQILPNQITSPSELKEVINAYPEPTDPSVIITPTTFTPDNVLGTLSVNYDVSKEVISTNKFINISSNEIISKPVEVIYTGFSNTTKEDQKDLKSKINLINSLSKSSNQAGSEMLPSTIKDFSTLQSNISAFPMPTNDGITITPVISTASDEKGTLEVIYNLTKNSASDKVAVTYSGFLTIDEKIVNNKINSINAQSNNTANGTGEGVFPKTIDAATLKQHVNNYPSSGTGLEVVDIKPEIVSFNDDIGTINVIYTVQKGETIKTSNLITYTNFLTVEKDDTRIVDSNIIAINSLPTTATEGKQILPSQITKETLFQNITNYPVKTEGAIITPISITNQDDNHGELLVIYEVKKGAVTRTTSITYKGFWTIDRGIVKTKIDEINNPTRNNTANGVGATIFPTAITEVTLKNYVNDYPQVGVTPDEVIITPQIKSPLDGAGTLIVTYTVIKGEVTQESNEITYSGFWTTANQNLQDENYIQQNIDNINTLPKTANGLGATVLPNTISEPTLSQTLTDYPTVVAGTEGTVIIPKINSFDNDIGVLNITYTVTKGAVPAQEVTFDYTGFLTMAEADKNAVQKNIDNINGLDKTANDNGANVYPSTITLLTLSDNIKESVVPVNNVEIATSIKSDQDAIGNLVVNYEVSRGGASQSIDITYTGFKQLVVSVTPISTDPIDPVYLPSVRAGWSQQIDLNHYLIGTYSDGVYQVETDVNNKVIKSIQVPMTGLNSIPNVNNGWAQKIDETHYLIGTSKDGVYQVVVDSNGMVTQAIQGNQVVGAVDYIPTVNRGFSKWMPGPNNYLIGTGAQGVYEVEVNNQGMIIKAEQVPMSGAAVSVPSVRDGFIQWVNDQQYLIGTQNDGLYQIFVDNTGKIIESTPVSTDIDNDDIAIPLVNTGFSVRLGNNNFLIGTLSDGVYQVSVNNDGKVIKTTPVSMNNTDQVYIPNVIDGWIEKINNFNFLVGTGYEGIFQITVDENGVVIKTEWIPTTGDFSIPGVARGFAQKITTKNYLIGTINQGLYELVINLP